MGEGGEAAGGWPARGCPENTNKPGEGSHAEPHSGGEQLILLAWLFALDQFQTLTGRARPKSLGLSQKTLQALFDGRKFE